MTYVVGLTGGIGCGKSTIERKFAMARSAAIIDADRITRELQAIGKAGYVYLHEEFGNNILNLDGTINPDKLRTMVFNDSAIRAKVESIMNPLIYHRVEEMIHEYGSLRGADHAWPEYVIFSAATLLKNRPFLGLVDSILVVDCDEETQIARVKARNGLDREEVEKIIRAQGPRYMRNLLIMKADHVITNNGTEEELDEKVENLNKIFIKAAEEKLKNSPQGLFA